MNLSLNAFGYQFPRNKQSHALAAFTILFTKLFPEPPPALSIGQRIYKAKFIANFTRPTKQFHLTLSLSRAINFKFPLLPRQTYYINQYGEPGFTKKKIDYCTTHTHYISYWHFSLKVGRMYFLNSGEKGLKKMVHTVPWPFSDNSWLLLYFLASLISKPPSWIPFAFQVRSSTVACCGWGISLSREDWDEVALWQGRSGHHQQRRPRQKLRKHGHLLLLGAAITTGEGRDGKF